MQTTHTHTHTHTHIVVRSSNYVGKRYERSQMDEKAPENGMTISVSGIININSRRVSCTTHIVVVLSATSTHVLMGVGE